MTQSKKLNGVDAKLLVSAPVTFHVPIYISWVGLNVNVLVRALKVIKFGPEVITAIGYLVVSSENGGRV